MFRKSLTTILYVIVIFGILSGCSSTHSTVGREIENAPLLDITKGSSTEDLVALLGKPKKIQSFEKDPENVSIWIYERERSQTEMVGLNSIDVPYVDPITGEMRMIKEPDYQPQTTKSILTIQVFVAEDQVLGWKVDREVERNIVD